MINFDFFLIAVAVVILILLIALLAWFFKTPKILYRKQDALFTKTELKFLAVLDDAVRGDFRVFGKVRFADIVRPVSGLSSSEYQSAFNRIKAKHMDFVLCDHCTMDFVCCIELDDSSHLREDRRERDEFVDDVLNTVEIPIIHIKTAKSYDINEIRNLIFDEIS